MKFFFSKIIFVLLYCFIKYSNEQAEEVYHYSIEDVYDNYISQYILSEEDYECIIKNISKIFLNSYAFNEIAKNPPQPYFDKNYYKLLDIQEKLENIDCTNPELNMYDFYIQIMEILSELKDMHIRINFKENNFDKFALVNPFNYLIKLENKEPHVYFDGCIDNIYDLSIIENKEDITNFCEYHSDYFDNPVKVVSINDQDPFDYFLNFRKITSTKNLHGTYSYIMQDTNYLFLDMIPFNFTDENMKQLKIEFDDEDQTIINTRYIIESDIDIYADEDGGITERRHLNNLYAYLTRNINDYSNKDKYSFKDKRQRIKKRLKARLNDYQVGWNVKYNEGEEDLFRCHVDSDNNVNVYYVHSFTAFEIPKYIEAIKACVELFDDNSYPIIVINDLNNGGAVVLAQIFLGVLSPLMPINKFKGRFRITDSFINSQEISQYIKTNFTNIYNCESASYDYLINGENGTNYSNNENLSEIFYLTNSTIQEEIEKIRKTMKNKRKPTEILVLTDGYSFSAASLYIKYLQKQGGAVVIGYSGNSYDDSIFDASQSPSPIFTHDILKIFNPEEITNLEEFGIEMEFAGIQTFYELNGTNVPLEYEVNPIDDRLDFHLNYNGNDDNYLAIVESAIIFLQNFDNMCYNNNKKIVKISENCDGQFENEFTHGGYLCSDDGYWTEECVPTYCDIGYIFDESNKICVKDICSSINDDEKEEENEGYELMEEEENEDKMEKYEEENKEENKENREENENEKENNEENEEEEKKFEEENENIREEEGENIIEEEKEEITEEKNEEKGYEKEEEKEERKIEEEEEEKEERKIEEEKEENEKEEAKIEKEEENENCEEVKEEKEEKEKIKEEENKEDEKENEENKEMEKENKEEKESEYEKEKKNENEEKEKENEKNKDDEIQTYVIVIAVIGSIAIIVATFLIIHYCRKKHITNEIEVDNNISKIELQESSEVIT